MCRFVFLLSLLGLTACYGCGWTSSPDASNGPSCRVAIVDLNEVARRLGQNKAIDALVQAKQDTLNERLREFQASWQQQLQQQRTELGQAPSEKQKRALLQTQQQARATIQQLQDKAVADLTRHRGQMVNEFRQQAKKVARAVAVEKSLDIVLTNNDTVVFTFQPAVDITADVIQKLRAARGPASSARRLSEYRRETPAPARAWEDGSKRVAVRPEP